MPVKLNPQNLFMPWEIVYYETFETIHEAISREKYFKSSAGRKYLKKVI